MPVLVTLDTETQIVTNVDAFIKKERTEPCLYGLHVCAFKYKEIRF